MFSESVELFPHRIMANTNTSTRKVVSDRALELGTKIAKRESQLKLICLVANDTNLVNSKILPSVQPSVGIKFHHKDIEKKKIQILTIKDFFSIHTKFLGFLFLTLFCFYLIMSLT